MFQVVITSINIDGNLLLIGSHQKEKVMEPRMLERGFYYFHAKFIKYGVKRSAHDSLVLF